MKKLKISMTTPIIGLDALKEEERIDDMCDGLSDGAAELVRGLQHLKFRKEAV